VDERGKAFGAGADDGSELVAPSATRKPFELPGLDCTFTRLAGPLPMYRSQVTKPQWRAAASVVRSLGGRLVTIWGIDRRTETGHFAVAVAYALNAGLVWLDLPLSDADSTSYPDLTAAFASAARMQRAVADLSGLLASGAADTRPWLRHAAWPEDYHPLRREPDGRERFDALDEAYPFVAVTGDGVHEIAVGPVHAGIIEPGHFRFSVVGEKVLRLEERLGYTHKGIEKRLEGMSLAQGTRLASRVSGDSTVAYGWAYCCAAEALCATQVPERAQWLRALALERERVANHLGDLGALGNDAAFSFGLAQFWRLREAWQRRSAELVGHRLMMDWIELGGVRGDLTAGQLQTVSEDCIALEAQVRLLESIYDAHAGLQDRFVGTGRVDAQLAQQLNLTGMAARASGVGRDLRSDFAVVPYEFLQVRKAHATDGDVAARVAVRFAEVYESLRLIRKITQTLPAGPVQVALPAPQPRGCGAGWIEAWRGEVLVTIELDDRGLIRRAHCHDPSWQNWPALEHAVIGNIVPDFPLINKSFNLSYSGQDL
jgi:Ni,Fe-hydrogenase III large subunit/Ni,Fe-hydrogenase III component G